MFGGRHVRISAALLEGRGGKLRISDFRLLIVDLRENQRNIEFPVYEPPSFKTTVDKYQMSSVEF
jgi:hypothetical protein